MMRKSHSMIFSTLCMVAGCDGDATAGTGTVQVFVAAEATVAQGLRPGTGGEDIVDGWAVDYDRFVVAVGNFHARRSAQSDDEFELPDVHVFDLTGIPSSGVIIGEGEVTAARWDRVGFDMPAPTADDQRHESVATADYERLLAAKASLLVAGTLSKADGRSCLPGTDDCVDAPTITFEWVVPAATAFADCAPPDGDSGFAVPTGGSVQVKPTIHGDHWFFSDISEGVEVTQRRAQWVADADLDRDGVTSEEELKQVPAADAFPSELYSLSNPFGPIETAWDYLVVQARTLGDFQGEGECPTRTPL